MPLLVDSSVWIDFFNGKITPHTNYLDQNLGMAEIHVGDLILTEVLQGFRSDQDFNTAKNLLLRFPIVSMVGSEIAVKSAQNYRFLRKKGITVRRIVDCWIATYCIEHSTEFLHFDSDFDFFERYLSLKVIHP